LLQQGVRLPHLRVHATTTATALGPVACSNRGRLRLRQGRGRSQIIVTVPLRLLAVDAAHGQRGHVG
jgi:hypothetical protein